MNENFELTHLQAIMKESQVVDGGSTLESALIISSVTTDYLYRLLICLCIPCIGWHAGSE